MRTCPPARCTARWRRRAAIDGEHDELNSVVNAKLAAAIDLVYRARRSNPDMYKNGVPVSPFGRQLGLFDGRGDQAVTDGAVLLLADLLSSGKTSDLRKVLAAYNAEATESASGQADIFSGKELSKEEILKTVTEHFKNATRGEQKKLVDAAVDKRKQAAAERGGRGKESEQTEHAAERGEKGSTHIQGESDSRVPEAHVGLNENEVDELVSHMENSASDIPQIELTPSNWFEQFGENGMVSTPMGEVKMGENQIVKLFEKGRSEQFGMIKPTLEHPQVIIEVPSEAIDGNTERTSSLLFIKTFIGKDGKKVYYFKSVTVRKDGLEVSISSHYDRAKRVKEALKKGELLYRFDGGAQTERHPADASVTTPHDKMQGEDDTIQTAASQPHGGTFSVSKDSASEAKQQEVSGKSAVAVKEKPKKDDDDGPDGPTGGKGKPKDGMGGKADGGSKPSERKIDDVGEHIAGNTLLYHRGPVVAEPDEAEQALLGAVSDVLKDTGIEVVTDVDEGQRVLDLGNGKDVRLMGSRVKKRMNEIGAALENGEMTDGQRKVAEVFSGKANNLRISVKRGSGSVTLQMRQGAEDKAGTKHSIFRHYGTGTGYITAEDVMKVTQVMSEGIATPKRRGKTQLVEYKLTKDGVTYTLVTEKRESDEVFNDFYTDRKAPLPDTFNTPEGARTDSSDASDAAKVGKISETANGGGNEKPRMQKVYHGSGADFEEFDHSHMGEGEGAQAYGWGTYVTEVKGIGKAYAHTKDGSVQRSIQERQDFIKQRKRDIKQMEDYDKYARKIIKNRRESEREWKAAMRCRKSLLRGKKCTTGFCRATSMK